MIEEGNKRAQEIMANTQKMIEKMDERSERMDKRYQETIHYIVSLIKSDGEKTRELINKVLEKMPS